MRVTVRINEFKRVLAESLHVGKEIDIPILANVKVEVNSVGRATMSAMSLNKSLQASIIQLFEVVDGEAGCFLLPAKQTHEFLKSHVGGTATIETNPDGRAIVKTGTFTMNVKCEPALHFPRLETMPEVRQEISLKFLKKLLTRVEVACPCKPGRVTVPFVRLESDGKTLRAVSTDNYRIAIAEVLGDWGVFTTLLPKSFLPLIRRRAGATVQFAESEGSYFYQTESVLLQCRKPITTFPPYGRAYSITFKSEIRLASADLKSAITNILSADRKLNEVIFDTDSRNLQVSTHGRIDSTVVIALSLVKGPPATTIRLDPHYVLDFLAHTEGDVTMHLPEDGGRMVKFSNGRDFQHFVMRRGPIESAEAKSLVA
jgi:DNA polymerase III sliding clamp (beta) subunit (PCNA family)